jgi:hypothetical protein
LIKQKVTEIKNLNALCIQDKRTYYNTISIFVQMKPNFARMMELIDEVFATRNDPGQIQVTPQQRKKLEQIHPATLSEKANEDGPLIWILLIPVIQDVMEDFLAGTINEKELLGQTQPGQNYEAIYLCSATTLPEARGKGDTKKLTLDAIHAIQKDHVIKNLFVWPFSEEGKKLAKKIARELGLELRIKE